MIDLRSIDWSNPLPDVLKHKITHAVLNGATPITLKKIGNYYYVCRPVTKDDKNLRESIKFIMISNTAYASIEKAVSELQRLLKKRGFTLYYDGVEADIEKYKQEEE